METELYLDIAINAITRASRLNSTAVAIERARAAAVVASPYSVVEAARARAAVLEAVYEVLEAVYEVIEAAEAADYTWVKKNYAICNLFFEKKTITI